MRINGRSETRTAMCVAFLALWFAFAGLAGCAPANPVANGRSDARVQAYDEQASRALSPSSDSGNARVFGQDGGSTATAVEVTRTTEHVTWRLADSDGYRWFRLPESVTPNQAVEVGAVGAISIVVFDAQGRELESAMERVRMGGVVTLPLAVLQDIPYPRPLYVRVRAGSTVDDVLFRIRLGTPPRQ